MGLRARVESSEASVSKLDPALQLDMPAFDGDVAIVDGGYLRLQEANLQPANALNLLDNRWHGEVAVLGVTAAEQLGIGGAGTGSRIWIAGQPVDVVGIVTSSDRDPSLKSTVLLSKTLANRLAILDADLFIRTRPGFPAPLAEAIPIAVDPAEPGTVKVSTVADLRSLSFGVSEDLAGLVGSISALLLILASLSAATAMYLSVQARAPEIALRRAIGASRSSIWRMFTFEGLVIGAAGGIAGSLAGVVVIIGVCLVRGWTPVLDYALVCVGLIVGCITGVLSASYPAWVAARANPAHAIRG